MTSARLSWTIDNYALGKRGCYRVVGIPIKYQARVRYYLQILEPNSGHWNTLPHHDCQQAAQCFALATLHEET